MFAADVSDESAVEAYVKAAEEVARLAMFLRGEDSQFITGTVNPIAGGMTA